MKTDILNSGIETRIAIEAIKGVFTVEELSEKYKVSKQKIYSWRTHLLLSVESVLDSASLEGVDERRAVLYKKIGRLYMENELLKKVLGK